tara:strand:- start:4583 stop:4786 length:204 start_codon:yes stop_codon:yes gene_type:complete
MMLIDNKFNISDRVYLETDTEQIERIVTEILIRKSSIMYALSCETNVSWHYDFEITATKNVLKSTTN